MRNVRNVLSLIWLPLFALAAVAVYYLIWGIFDLPPQEEVVRLAEQYFDTYGLITVFIAAIIEAVLFVGWYFPGSLVIVLGVVFAGRDFSQLFGVFAVTTLGFFVAYTFNYFVGKYGWYRLLLALGLDGPIEKAQAQLVSYGPRAIFLTFWHPNFGGLTSTAAGILQMPLRTFLIYMIAATTLWDIFWTIVGFSFGEFAITAVGPKVVVPFIAAWIAITLYVAWRKKKDASAVENSASAL
ncbi:MAG: VTT domain-containing protein [Patescibacteria group bacterium]|nr:VTT domain-containing protein [Patescibacteria group bacterium]